MILLPGFPHADPADRVICATALSLGAPLVTVDEAVRGWSGVPTIW